MQIYDSVLNVTQKMSVDVSYLGKGNAKATAKSQVYFLVNR